MRVARAVVAAGGSVLVTGFVAGAAVAGPAVGAAAGQVSPVIALRPGVMHLTRALNGPPTTAYCKKNFKIACYTARQIERAFNLNALYATGITGKGETIVIVDSYGSPTVAHDLAVFDKASHLPAPPSLKIIQPAGKVARYKANGNREGWAGSYCRRDRFERSGRSGSRA
jgi:subtilase family serine protease